MSDGSSADEHSFKLRCIPIEKQIKLFAIILKITLVKLNLIGVIVEN